MATISLSPAFFTKELQAYSDWRSAFWRELVQNSVDAGASQISVELKEEAGECVVNFLDNASGMDLNTLENVYFVVGETSKTGTDSIGGFGRARILTCFGHVSWTIATNEWVCSGSGTQYEIAKSETKQSGCLVQVVISLASMDEMQYALDYYLQNCQLACKVWVNGKLFERWAYRNRLAGELSFGKVFLNKSKARYSVLVRVNGVHMFARYTQAAWQIVIEIEPARSRQVLTSNRDGLTYAAGRELDDFIGSIWVSPCSAVRHRPQSFREDGGAPVYRVTSKKLDRLSEEEGATSAGTPDPAVDEMPEFVQEAVSQPPAYSSVCESAATSSISCGDGRFLKTPNPTKRAPIGYVLSVACSSRPLKVAALAFRTENIGGTRLKLLNKWTAACTIAAEEFAELEEDSFAFRTRFTFVEDELASCSLNEEGVGDLLLRPVQSNGTLAYKISSKADTARLLALAAHEVVHLRYRGHDERFALSLTMLFGRLFVRLKRR